MSGPRVTLANRRPNPRLATRPIRPWFGRLTQIPLPVLLLALVATGCEEERRAPVRHKAVALLRVQTEQASALAASSDGATERFKQAQLAELTSEAMLRALSKRDDFSSFGLVTQVDLQQAVEVEFPGSSNLMRMTVASRDALRSLRLAEAILDVYLKQGGQGTPPPNPLLAPLLEEKLKSDHAAYDPLAENPALLAGEQAELPAIPGVRFSKQDLSLLEAERTRLQDKLLRTHDHLIRAETDAKLAGHRGDDLAACEAMAAEARRRHTVADEHLQATTRLLHYAERDDHPSDGFSGPARMSAVDERRRAITAKLQYLTDEGTAPARVTLEQAPQLLDHRAAHPAAFP